MGATGLGLALATLVGVSLGFFGGGGSILTVPLLVYVFGLPPKSAIASSLLVVAAASAVGAVRHAHAGSVDVRSGLLFGAAGMASAHAGARAAAWLDGGLLLLLFSAVMGLTASAMWRGRRAPAEAPAGGIAPTRLLLQGLAVGGLTGLVGAGGGFLIVPALVLFAGLPMRRAVGTSLVVIVLNTLAGFAGYVGHAEVDGPLTAAVATAAVAGSFLGTRLAHRVDPEALRRAFAGFVAAMAAVILVREAEAWLPMAREALPHSLPQAAFALLMLGVGLAAGRVRRRAAGDAIPDPLLSDGGGI